MRAVGQRRVELEHEAARARARGREVARQREAAAPDVECAHGRARTVEGVDRVADRARVVELEVGRVGDVDVGVAERVEQEQTAGRARGVAVDARAVVAGLELAAVPHRQRPGRHREQREHGGEAAARATGGARPPAAEHPRGGWVKQHGRGKVAENLLPETCCLLHASSRVGSTGTEDLTVVTL